MRLIVLTLIAVSIFGCGSSEDGIAPLVFHMSKLGPYAPNEKVSVRVMNISGKKNIYGIGLEGKREGKWEEDVFNTESPWPKGAYIYFELEPNAARTHEWPNKNSPSFAGLANVMRDQVGGKSVTLRFKVTYNLNGNNTLDEVYASPNVWSNEFVFRKPKPQ